PPSVRAPWSDLRAHLWARGGHQRGRWNADLRSPAARRGHRARRSRRAPVAARVDAEAGHLTARTGRTVVPARQSLRPHSHRLLKTWGKPDVGETGFPPRAPSLCVDRCRRGLALPAGQAGLRALLAAIHRMTFRNPPD